MLFLTDNIPTSLEALEVHSPKVYAINHVSIDSRSVNFGDRTLFIALVTTSGNGHHHIEDAYEKGVRAFLISEALDYWRVKYPDACFIRVSDTLASLQQYARERRLNSRAKVVAITGSNGKTIVKEMLYSLLYRDIPHLYRSPGSYNSQIGVALALITMPIDTELAFIEAGISKPGEMSKLAHMIQPDELILTHIGSAHLEHFVDKSEIRREKLILGQDCHSIYSYEDLPPYDALLNLAPFVDSANRRNLSLAISYIKANFPHIFKKLPEYIADLKPVEMRLELKENIHGKLLINDSYSSDIESLAIALDMQKQLGGTTVVLTPIEQSALPLSELSHKVVALLEAYSIRRAYLIDWPRPIPTANTTDLIGVESINIIIRDYRDNLLNEHALLIKGARHYHLEELVQNLVLKEHATKLEVNLSSIRHNLSVYRDLLPKGCQTICMIKADAYGLGAMEVARILENAHTSYLAVAVADEGKALRKGGITMPIIVMNPTPDSLETLRRYQLDAEVYSLEMLRHFAQAKQQGKEIGLHLKVDSGMHRLGFEMDDLPALQSILKENDIHLKSIFSHLAVADDTSQDAYTHAQASYLKSFYEVLSPPPIDNKHPKPMLHLLNTAGVERFAETYAFDGVRIGIGLYGHSPTGYRGVQPTACLKTQILQIKSVPAGSSVGYGGQAITERDTVIAVLPIGYADGLRRLYGNGHWHVSIRGSKCPIIGNICMDACMVDVTDIAAQEGDEVIIFGDALTPLEEMARVGATIPYEILTSITPRVARIYLKE